MIRFLSILLCLILVVSFSAQAQDADLDKRVELSQKLHAIMPVSVREQVNAAIDQFVQMQPEAEREVFRANIQSALNYQVLEKISIDTMAEIYTAGELQTQIDYYSKPEAKAISDKYKQYADKVYPEITKMLDKALLDARTGR